MKTNQAASANDAQRTEEQRRARIRVPAEVPAGLLGKALAWYSRRAYGDVLDLGLVLNHHRRILFAMMGEERRIARWNKLDPELKTLAVTAAAANIGCSWCLDFGYHEAQGAGQSVERLGEVSRWRESAAFTELERDVLAYAESMTATPPVVTGEMVDKLVARLGVPAVVELTKMVAVANGHSRFNAAMGLTSQGFADRCELIRG